MANNRLIDLDVVIRTLTDIKFANYDITADLIMKVLKEAPTVDAVIISDKKLLRAVNLLLKQYEHSRKSDYVHSPVAHALYHTWKQVDEGGGRE